MMAGSGDQDVHFVSCTPLAPTVCKIDRRFEQFAVSRLSRIDCDIDCGIRAEIVAVVGMLLHEPMPNSSLNLTDEVEAALLPVSQHTRLTLSNNRYNMSRSRRTNNK
jgi:hypothetical protein